MKRTFYSVLLAVLLSGIATAHEFWLEPETFRPDATTESVSIQINVGMNFAGKLWGGSLPDILEIPVATGSGTKYLASDGGLKEPLIELKAETPGQYLVGLTNKSAFIELDADAFKKYVLSEGLEQIVQQRESLGESEQPGRELYRRCAKVLIQQGDDPEQLSYDESFGFPVEFQALENPYEDGRELLSFKLLSQDEPLADAQVVIWHKNGEELKRTDLRTNEDGIITLSLRQEGIWMVSSVHMERAEESEKADWQSYWASYTFGYR